MRGWDEGAVLDDRYELGARLGQGGSAAVHRAWDRERGREVAVKLLPPGDDRPGQGESDILGALDHPRLVALHDVLVTAEGTALVMELVDGPSLHERLERGPLPAPEAFVVLRDVASGLAHAHRRGVVHRDVKPGNVLLRLEGGRVVEAKLSDFGIARRTDATRTTGERTVVGTVRYLSPEQARGERVTAASDVYSLGLTVLAALTGEDAFPGRETESLAGRMLRPPVIPSALPADLADLLREMTALDPEERPDASAVAALAHGLGAVRPVVETVDVATRPIDLVPLARLVRPRRRTGRMVAAVAGMAVAGAVLGGLVAVVLAPTAVEHALSGITHEQQPAPVAAPIAPATKPTAPAVRPSTAASKPTATVAPAPSAAPHEVAAASTPKAASGNADDRQADDHGRRSGNGSSGHGGSGKGSSGNGASGKGSGGHGSDD